MFMINSCFVHELFLLLQIELKRDILALLAIPSSAVQDTDNFTCWARSSAGVDSLTHQVIALTPPAAPSLSLSHATHHALNLSITPAGDGGAPILGGFVVCVGVVDLIVVAAHVSFV